MLFWMKLLIYLEEKWLDGWIYFGDCLLNIDVVGQ